MLIKTLLLQAVGAGVLLLHSDAFLCLGLRVASECSDAAVVPGSEGCDGSWHTDDSFLNVPFSQGNA